jgi:hypothetical protein
MIINPSEVMQVLILLWMTRSITDDIPGCGTLFRRRAGDGTASVSLNIITLECRACHFKDPNDPEVVDIRVVPVNEYSNC